MHAPVRHGNALDAQAGRQALAGQQHVALIGLVRAAHRHGIGLHAGAYLVDKALGQRLQVVGFGHLGADGVQRLQLGVLGLQAGGFLAHFEFQILRGRLQRSGHQVKARGHAAELSRPDSSCKPRCSWPWRIWAMPPSRRSRG